MNTHIGKKLSYIGSSRKPVVVTKQPAVLPPPWLWRQNHTVVHCGERGTTFVTSALMSGDKMHTWRNTVQWRKNFQLSSKNIYEEAHPANGWTPWQTSFQGGSTQAREKGVKDLTNITLWTHPIKSTTQSIALCVNRLYAAKPVQSSTEYWPGFRGCWQQLAAASHSGFSSQWQPPKPQSSTGAKKDARIRRFAFQLCTRPTSQGLLLVVPVVAMTEPPL